MSPPCTGCGQCRPRHARGLCLTCYGRARRAGTLPARVTTDPAALTAQPVPVADPAAVERLLAGQPVHPRRADRAEAARRLTRCGVSAALIAERLRCTERTVTRYRAALRAAS